MEECGLQQPDRRPPAFTLIELMAVVVVIAILTAITLGVASYIQKRMANSNTAATIASLETQLENYKSDWGYYPATTPIRISATGFWEATNNWILYMALSGANGGKQYLRVPPSQLRLNTAGISNSLTGAVNYNGGLTNICDAWGTPFNYFNSPNTPQSNMNPCVGANALNIGYVRGGQVNVRGFDLWSYGADGYTYIPGGASFISGQCGGFNIYPWYSPMWTYRSSGFDDITNFGK